MNDDLPRLPPRRDDAHKGDFGLALIVGGSRGMAGAAGLAGMAALRGGAGLVRLAVPDPCLETIAAFEPSYVTIPLPADDAGRIAAAAFDQIADMARRATVLACGPGLGRSLGLDSLVVRLYQEIAKPMVLDADALNALAAESESLAHPGGPRVLTPHPGEFARLIGRKLDGDARNEAAIELAGSRRIVVVLKGHRTLVTDGRRRFFNTTGNPGMATGG
ncbi:MAG: NAD(P)H-hydrate dehydratase, partial [Thermoguttaceae bacterium]